MQWLRNREFSLRARLVALVAALLLAVSLFLFWYFPARMDGLARVWLERRATGMAHVLANAVAPGLEFDDATLVTELLGGLKDSPEAVYAALRKEDGTVLAAWNAQAAHDAGARGAGTVPTTRVLVEGGVLHVLEPVRTKSGQQGLLTMGFSLAELAQEQHRNLLAVGGVAAGVFVVGLALLGLLGTLLVRPLRRMGEVALRIAEGDLAGAEVALGGREAVAGMAASPQGGQQHADEVRQLSRAFAQMLQSLRDASSTLTASAHILSSSVSHLTGISGEHRSTVTRQAAALQQTQVTAEEIRQTGVVAAQKAEAVMQVASRAEAVSQQGESAIAQTLAGLSSIRARVEEVASHMAGLSERTRQIGGITQSVKDLADQSNMLALNAAIEAVRSGEHGKGFGVVAREIRTLADQSIQSTARVRDILEDIGQAVAQAVAQAGEGSAQVEAGLAQVRTSGDTLQALASIVKDNADAVRQIAGAVSQQNVGFSQLFTAVTDLSGMMADTVKGLDATEGAVAGLAEVSARIAQLAGRYRL